MRIPLLLVLVALQFGSYLLFLKGFFPTKVLLSPVDLVNFKSTPPAHYEDPKPQFKKLVFMVVDALRADFMFSNDSSMELTHQLLNDGYGVGFTAYSSPPTVTLPRLKGITTGSTPNFIDAVLNIAEEDTSSTLGDQDSWIQQMSNNGWKINMFGDDTWLKLFPNHFAKVDGTASFYVSDFTIVDNNVTRHLDHELSNEGRQDWDCLILHYLGLDHIGHKGGPSSANMPTKQKEMDHIISRIFKETVLDDDETLLVVLGDHGMNEVGNHGGSSIGEVSAALSLFSSKFTKLNHNKDIKAPIEMNPDYEYFTKIDQIDLVPTLATLLGLQVPINNLGAFIDPFLDLYETEADKINVLTKNALQLKVLLDKMRGVVSTLESDIGDLKSVDNLQNYIAMAKEQLSKTSSNYNYDDINFGLAGYLATTIIALVVFLFHYRDNKLSALIDLTFFIVYAVNFFGSSMIEEEHHLWWFFTTVFLSFVALRKLRAPNRKSTLKAVSVLFIALRILKAWNNSGQKNNIKANMKISSFLSSLPSTVGPVLMACLIVSTYIPFGVLMISGYLGNDSVTTNTRFISFMSLTMLAFCSMSVKFLSYLSETFDLSQKDVDIPGWCRGYLDWLITYSATDDFNSISLILFDLFHKVWIVVFIAYLFKPLLFKALNIQSRDGNHYNDILVIISMLLINQTNFSNVPIFASLLVILESFPKLVVSKSTTYNSNLFSLFTILLQNLSFFQFGSTNSLSSVDLTNSFNGLANYNMILVGILTFVSNWGSPIFWSLGYLKLSLDSLPNDKERLAKKWDIVYNRMVFNLMFYSISGLILICSCYNLRFHLFIWTVFSPKLLYFLSWIGCSILVDCLLCCLVTAFYC
ncbi:hypothetical protein CANARDRAFT_30043 [[Candida] arabinofermentans NRRL YB-2248]|uniref:GPI ethanolamine phosphate transferase 2 n=1 Tax=[Candida] arabinofermentans NRRL YB-2248 TaxID=983967 RepID=A0A1E4SVA6_9ASCO|nr:hypothetical protein CANARDRAFT_30043 [[Candida] arabinofermentans NRRL YB-2248]